MPRPPRPTIATLILSFAPQTRVAAAAVAAPRKNRREVELDMNLRELLYGTQYIKAAAEACSRRACAPRSVGPR